jgi:hypothetical protein
MTKEIMELQVNNTICGAVGCFARATTKINVRVGQLGTIPLALCANCVRKFDKNGNGVSFRKADLKQKVARNEEDKRRYDEVIKE